MSVNRYKPGQAVPIDVETLRYYMQEEIERIGVFSDEIVDTLFEINEPLSEYDPDVSAIGPLDAIQLRTGYNGVTLPDAGYTPPAGTGDLNGDTFEQNIYRGLIWWKEDIQSLAHQVEKPYTTEVYPGREVAVRCQTLSPITKGSPVIVWAVSPTGNPFIEPAQANGTFGSNSVPRARVLGVAKDDAPLFSFAYVQVAGTIFGLDTTQDSDGNSTTTGDIIYLSSLTLGGWTVVPPVTGIIVRLGIIGVVDAADGQLLINYTPPPPFEALTDLNLQNTTQLDGVVFNANAQDADVPPNTVPQWFATNMVSKVCCSFYALGNGAANLSPTRSFNLDQSSSPGLTGAPTVPGTTYVPDILWVSTGLYRVFLRQFQYGGYNYLDHFYPHFTILPREVTSTGGATNEFIVKTAYATFWNSATGQLDFSVYRHRTDAPAGDTNVTVILDDLESADEIWCQLHFNYQDEAYTVPGLEVIYPDDGDTSIPAGLREPFGVPDWVSPESNPAFTDGFDRYEP